jgi:hypothetical protein
MSHIRSARIEEFRRLYAEDFREEISKEDASVLALRLIELSCWKMAADTNSSP